MKRLILIFVILTSLISCEKLQRNDEKAYAVVTDKDIASIKVFNEKDDMTDKYEYSYNEAGAIISVDHNGTHYAYYYDNTQLVGITCSSYAFSRVLTYDERNHLVAYSVYKDGKFVVKYALDYENDRISCFNILSKEDSHIAETSMPYVWKESNLHSIGNMNFTYNEILNNFNVPIPELSFPSHGLILDPLFAGFGISQHMIHTSQTSSLSEYSYLRNSEGDITRINVNNGKLYYIIEYID